MKYSKIGRAMTLGVACTTLAVLASCAVDSGLISPPEWNEVVPKFRPGVAVTSNAPVGSGVAGSVLQGVYDCTTVSAACAWTDIHNYGSGASGWEVTTGTYWRSFTPPYGAVGAAGESHRFAWYIGTPAPMEVRTYACVAAASSYAMTGGTCADINWHPNSCDVRKNRVSANVAHTIVSILGYANYVSTSLSLECAAPVCLPESSKIGTPRTSSSSQHSECMEDGGDNPGGGEDTPSYDCSNEWISIDYFDGSSWSTIWEGNVEVCEYAM
ncbi:MAG: hypothetical protein JWM95_5185 [Gemmatimonadetes bacterium]|nr:hypothetical protein [Gemmatimonadota bacterium]